MDQAAGGEHRHDGGRPRQRVVDADQVGTRAGQQDSDRAENKATLRRLVTAGGVNAIPLAPDGRRVGQLLQRQLGTGGYRWNGKGLIGDPRLTEWIIAASKAASTLPDVRQYKDNTQGGF